MIVIVKEEPKGFFSIANACFFIEVFKQNFIKNLSRATLYLTCTKL